MAKLKQNQAAERTRRRAARMRESMINATEQQANRAKRVAIELTSGTVRPVNYRQRVPVTLPVGRRTFDLVRGWRLNRVYGYGGAIVAYMLRNVDPKSRFVLNLAPVSRRATNFWPTLQRKVGGQLQSIRRGE